MYFGNKFEANAALAAKLAGRRPLERIFDARRPPKGAKREPSWRQKDAKTHQNDSKKACQVASKNSMRKSSQLGANMDAQEGGGRGRGAEPSPYLAN